MRSKPGGQVERRRGAVGSKPVFAGTRVPVDTVRRYLDAGHTVAQVLESFPTLTVADVEARPARRSLILRFVCDHDVDAAVAVA